MLKPETEEKLRELLTVFLEENKKLNLSAFRTEETCWIGNISDSLAFLDVLPSLLIVNGQLSIVDIGTGGGFPLLPLALALPGHQFTGIDATRKKVDAVHRIIEKLNITNARAIIGRAEELGHDYRHREQYDCVLSRAVGELPTLLEYCSPFAKTGGHIILWKSLTIEQELIGSLRAAKEFQCELVTQHRYTLPGNFGERQLIVFHKTSALSGTYPRTTGLAKKKPLR